MGDEDDELGKCATDLSTRALEQVLREAVGVRKQNIVCKPIAYILTVSQQDAEGVVPEGKDEENIYRGPHSREKTLKKKKKWRQTELTSHWQDPVLLSWCENLC